MKEIWKSRARIETEKVVIGIENVIFGYFEIVFYV
jgi:hypothetical protein